MKNDEKVALVRILTELVKSDTVICKGELDTFGNICEKYDIKKQESLAKAYGITLASAVLTLKAALQEGRFELQEVLDAFKRLSLADGNCERSEALLITSLRRVLNGDGEIDCSCDVLDNIAPFTVFYVESDYDEELNKAILDNYRVIELEFRLLGFEFVYIPVRIESFKKIDKDTLKDIICHLAPTVAFNNEEAIDDVYKGICNLDTVKLCKSLLYNKLGLSSLYDTDPAFLVKIGDSRVSFKPVHNYYKFVLQDENVLEAVGSFLAEYREILKDDKIEIYGKNGDNNSFEYRGFNKSIFDLLAFPGKSCVSRILVDTYSSRVIFDDIQEVLDAGAAYERALYAFALYTNISGISVSKNEKDDKKVARNNKLFKTIYEKISGEEYANESWVSKGINSALSRIKKCIMSIDLLERKEDYVLRFDESGRLSIKVDSDKVFVKTSSGKELMKDSSDWSKLKSIK